MPLKLAFAFLLFLGFSCSLLADNQDVVPLVEIVAPDTGFCTNQSSINIAVWFSAYKEQNGKSIGNVQTVELLLNGTIIATYQNPPNVKTGGANFPVTLSTLPEGTLSFQAYAYQGNKKAGLKGVSKIVTVTIDRTPPTISISPANGFILNTATPLVTVQYADALCGVNTASLIVRINGIDRTALFTVTPSQASYQLTSEMALQGGENTNTASISDKAGNVANASSTFIVRTLPPTHVGPPDGFPLTFNNAPPCCTSLARVCLAISIYSNRH